ncbi:MAG: hypothetical protein C4297_00015 [Gemmataceae bacterium]
MSLLILRRTIPVAGIFVLAVVLIAELLYGNDRLAVLIHGPTILIADPKGNTTGEEPPADIATSLMTSLPTIKGPVSTDTLDSPSHGNVGAQAGKYQPARGPLRVHPDNPRYFTDGTRGPDNSLRAVYLTGAHTWNNLVDIGPGDPPEPFDFDEYLAFLQRHNHNFIRLWTWDSSTWDVRANGERRKEPVLRAAPLPYARTGPGAAADGKPRFDLTRFHESYFRRLRERVEHAGQRGIYVSVMLFEGWGLFHANRRKPAAEGWAWKTHPFHPANNINGLDPSLNTLTGAVHSRRFPEVNRLQEAYIRKVVETVGDLDNVLYEVINEGGEKDWDWWVVDTVRKYQKARGKIHPIGLTGHGAERLPSMLASPADWVSPGRQDGFAEDPPAWNENKVSLLDTDHIWGVGGERQWVWKSFLRGHNPLFMDPYEGVILGRNEPRWEAIRKALGQTRRWAERINLARMKPSNKLSSTGYCLAHPGHEYLVYQPKPEAFTVRLADGKYKVEWYDPLSERTITGTPVAGGEQKFQPPFPAEALLYLVRLK